MIGVIHICTNLKSRRTDLQSRSLEATPKRGKHFWSLSPLIYMVGDIHIQTLNPEGQTSSQGPQGQTLRSLGATPKRGIQFFGGILNFLKSHYFLILQQIIKHRGRRVLIFTLSGSKKSKCGIIWQKNVGPSTSQGGQKLPVHPIDLKMVAKLPGWTNLN